MNWPTGSVPQEQIDLFLSYFLIWVSFWASLIYKFCCGLFNFSRWCNSLINQPTWWGNVNAETHFRSSLSGRGGLRPLMPDAKHTMTELERFLLLCSFWSVICGVKSQSLVYDVIFKYLSCKLKDKQQTKPIAILWWNTSSYITLEDFRVTFLYNLTELF